MKVFPENHGLKVMMKKMYVCPFSLPWYMTNGLYPMFQVFRKHCWKFSYFSKIENQWKSFTKIRSLKVFMKKSERTKGLVCPYILPWCMTILLESLLLVRYLTNIAERFSYFSKNENLWKCFTKIHSLKIIVNKFWDDLEFCFSV